MLDIQFIRENRDRIKRDSHNKSLKVDIDHLLELDEKRRQLLQKSDGLRSERNLLASSAKGDRPDAEQIKRGKKLKEQLVEIDEELRKAEESYSEILMQVPNIIPEDTPLGGEEANRQEKTWGNAQASGALDHLAWGEKNGMIDFERGAKVAGSKFYYLKGSLVELELAVFQYALNLVSKQGFIPMTVPHMVNTRTAAGTGFLPRGEERQIYKIEGEDLNLIATAEMPITGYHADEILDESSLPLCYAGLSPAYRMESGAYGKHSKGLYRTHQFNKLELYVFCKPKESESWHNRLIALEEELCQALEIPYRLVRIAAGDLGAPAYKKYDVEYWSPVDQNYRELMSCSNVTDYQARRLNIRYRDSSGSIQYVHTLNGTAAAMSRIPIALIENLQTVEGRVRVPKALQPYMNGREYL